MSYNNKSTLEVRSADSPVFSVAQFHRQIQPGPCMNLLACSAYSRRTDTRSNRSFHFTRACSLRCTFNEDLLVSELTSGCYFSLTRGSARLTCSVPKLSPLTFCSISKLITAEAEWVRSEDRPELA